MTKAMKPMVYCTNRSVEDLVLFDDTPDRADFLSRLVWITESNISYIYGVVLERDRYHLLLGEHGYSTPSRIAGQVAIGYARAYNLRHSRIGQVFCRRKHTLAVSDPETLQQLETGVFSVPRDPSVTVFYDGGRQVLPLILAYLKESGTLPQ